jgi:hypothetical protein
MPWQLQQHLATTSRGSTSTQHRPLFSRERQQPINLLSIHALLIDRLLLNSWQTLVQHG